MIHWSSFDAVQYRGISGLSLPTLGHANVITGVNGVGKTALLEAMWLFTGRHNPGLLWNHNVRRSELPITNPISELGGDQLELHGSDGTGRRTWKVVFRAMDEVQADRGDQTVMQIDGENRPVPVPLAGRIESWIDGKAVKEIQSTVTPSGVVAYGIASPGRTHCIIEGTRAQLEIPEDYLQRYSNMVREGRKKELTRALSLILPKIRGLEILTDESGKSYVSADTSRGNQLPLQALGGGALRLFKLYVSFFTARHGMVLVDEIENGIHYSVLRDLWLRVRTWMQEWAIQFVATTHSAECIDAALEAFAESPEDLAIHKLYADAEAGKVRAVTFTGESLEGARDLDLEMR